MATDSPHSHPSAPLLHGSLAILLLLLAGSTFSLGLFIPGVEAAAKPGQHLDGIWETAMGAMHFLSGPIMILCSLYLDAGVESSSRLVPLSRSKNFRLRVVNLICVVAFASFSISASGAAHSNRVALFSGVAVQAFPLAILFLTCMQALLVWYPHRSGLAIGLGHAAFGAGTVITTELFSLVLTRTDPVFAIYTASAILSTSAFFPAMFMRWPSENEISKQEEENRLLERLEPIERIPVSHIIRLPNFWLYIFTIFSTSVTYMLNPYYFKLGHLFGRPLDKLVLYFNISNIASTLCSLFVSTLTDFVRSNTGFFFSGSKNIMIFLMFLQTICLYLSINVNNTQNFRGFVVLKATMKIIEMSHVGCAALLARDLFGLSNSCIAFGFGAGLALGGGEAASAWLMGTVEALARPISAPSDYNPFYLIAVVWSTMGLICVMAVQRHKNSHKYEQMFP
ncbi:unnamed protein product [Agarophyton chilense]